jgi:phosphate transport system permease protein
VTKARFDDLGFRLGTGLFGFVIIALVAGIAVVLYSDSTDAIGKFGWRFWQTQIWDPVAGEFGARPFIWGTLYSAVLAPCCWPS